ncbi:hypothetical protein [Streptococcus castoreus]|nr:hypothetical protein [Streptococcus castoreus]
MKISDFIIISDVSVAIGLLSYTKAVLLSTINENPKRQTLLDLSF